MKRRTFLKSAVASLALLPMRTAAALAAPAVQQSFVVLSDVSEEVSFSHLITVLDALTERNIPVICAVSPFDAAQSPLGPASKMAQLLAGYLLAGGNIEIAPYVPELARQSAHFQARSAFEAGQSLQSMLAPLQTTGAASTPLQTIICDETANPTAPTGVRSAGIYNVLVLPKFLAPEVKGPEFHRPVQSQTWENGTVRLFGGQRVSLSSYKALPAAGDPTPTQRLFCLSAQEFSRSSPKELEVAANQFCEDLLLAELDGDLSLQPLSDLQLRNDYGFRRHISWVLVNPGSDEGALAAPFAEFQAALRAQGTAFTQVAAPLDGETEAGQPKSRLSQSQQGYWVPSDRSDAVAAQDDTWPGMIPVEIATSPTTAAVTVRTTRPLGPGVGVAFNPLQSQRTGFDRNGFLLLSRVDIRTEADLRILQDLKGGTDDLVIFIHPQSLGFAPVRRALLAGMSDLRDDGVTRVLQLDQFARFRFASDPISARRRKAESVQPELASSRKPLSSSARAALLDDARVAWRYFERFTNKTTGLCPATVNSSPGGRLHETVTMWDVGSHINGLIAATQIGLLDRKAFETRIRKILPNIAGRVSQGRRLPQGWIRTDRHRWGNKNFDGSDGGRLLASLDNLRRFGGFEDRLDELVGSWNLQEIVVDGRIHSVINEKLVSSYVSHSAHYSAIAFRRWGIAAASPYEVFQGESRTDDQMALLEMASDIGPIGAEPLLLEAMELGISPESAYLADVLYSAQLEEYRETGQLTCVSEGPIDRSPWFTYQGLQLDAATRTWATDTVGKEPEYRTPEFRENHLVVSSKSAFLWAAHQPHDYSDILLRHVREKSKTENGFSSSIFVKTGRATEAYTDLNTNGVILQAIAHRLGAAG
ncbi:hypothetical protein PH5382_02493 [Phaeobacter sp. CECT 5382]|nr:hypothetical protein PH5382_02493 [Phaeobacter sp. CECT 5382]